MMGLPMSLNVPLGAKESAWETSLPVLHCNVQFMSCLNEP